MAENCVKLLRYLLAFFPILILFNISFAQEWLSGWRYRIPITISEKSGNDLPVYQIYFDLNRDFLNRYPSLTKASKFVFTDSDGTTLIPYWIEKIPYQGISAEAYYSLESERCFYHFELPYYFPSTPNKLETNWWDNNLLSNPQYNDVFVRIKFSVDNKFKFNNIMLVVEGDDGFVLYVNDYFIDAKGSLGMWYDYSRYCYDYYYYCYYCYHYSYICESCAQGEYYPECDWVCPFKEWYCHMCSYCASHQYSYCHIWWDLGPSYGVYNIKDHIRSGYNEIKIWCSKETVNGSCRFKIIVDDEVILTNIQNYDTFGRVWIKVPNITANSNKTIYMYYSGHTTLNFNGDDVFDFFDDFNYFYLNENKWVYSGGDSIIIENNKLRIVTDNNPPTGTIQSLNPITLNNYALEFKVKVVSEPQENCNFGIMDSDRGDGKGYWPFFSYGGKVNIYKRSDGNWELLESIDGAYTLEKTHVSRIVKNGNSYTYYIDDTQIGQTHTVDTGPETYIISPRIWGEYIGESCFMYFDDLKVRRYVYPEPDIAFGEAERLIINVSPPTIVPSGKFKAFNVSENIGIDRTNYVYTISVKDMNCFRIYAEEEVNERTIGGERRYVPVRVVDWNESECKAEVLLNLSKNSWKVVYIGESLTDIDYSYYDEIFKEYGNFFVPFEKEFPLDLNQYLVVKSYWFNKTTAMLFLSYRSPYSWLNPPSKAFIWNILNNSVVEVPGYFWRDYSGTQENIVYNTKALYYSKSKGIGLISYDYRPIFLDGEDSIATFTENEIRHAFNYPGPYGSVTSLDCNETDSEIVCYFVQTWHSHVGKIRIYPNVEFLGGVTYLPFSIHPYAVKVASNGKYIWFGGQQCYSTKGFYVARYNTETNQFDVTRYIDRNYIGECPGAIGDIECIDENNCIATSEYTLFKITPTETIDILPEIRLSKDECWNEFGNVRCFTSSLHKFDNNVFYFTYFEDYVSDSKVIRYDYNRNKFYEYAWLRYDGKNVSQLHATGIKSMMLYDDTTGIFSGILRTGYYNVEENRYIVEDYGNILMIRQQDVQEIEVTTPPTPPQQIVTEWLSGWQYRIPITITEKSGNNLTDYQVLITINTQSLINQNKMRSDCGDIRFTDSDGITLIPYWIEEGCNSANTRIWVKVPNIPANGQKTIYLYYGNSQAENIGKMWNNITHLGIYGGVFDYNPLIMSHYKIAFGSFTCFLSKDGYLHCRGNGIYGQSEDYYGGDAIAVSAGTFHTCILKSNGNVDCYGANWYGQVINYTGGDAIAVSAGLFYTCILKSNGNVECYGENWYGQSINYYGGDAIAVSAGYFHTCILKSNGNVECYGNNDYGQSEDYYGGDAIAVSAGLFHTCILKSNGNVECYGENWYGQSINYYGGDAIAVSTGSYHTCILKSNGNVECYGNNDYGQSEDYYGGDAIAVSAGYYHTCILKSNGNVECYGNNDYGQSEDYYGGDAIAVSAGYQHTCILKSNGNVECYGLKRLRYVDTSLVVSSGGWHVCILKSDGNVECYGLNDYGQSEDYYGGDAIALSAGYFHTCILKSNGNVDCYGRNDYGQSNDYGDGDAIAVSAGYYHTCILKSNGNVECYGDNWYGQSEDYYGGDAIAVSAGLFHTCILKSNGNVECYGENWYGQSINYTGGDVIAVSSGEMHTCILKSNGNVECYGYNLYGQVINYTGGDAIAVSAGTLHTCILKSNGNVECYGNNDYGQSEDYYGGDAYNPFRKYAYPEPAYALGEEEIVTYQPPQYPEYCEFVVNSPSILYTEGYYCLVNNITETTLDTIFSIYSNNAVFDCLGNSIISNGKNAFYLNGPYNMTIKNCVIKNSKIAGMAYLLNITNNTLISEDTFTVSSFYCEYCHIFNNTLISITNGIRRVHISLRPQAKNIYIYDNILMAENTTAISYGVNDALTHIGTFTAENVYIFNNYGYSDYGSLSIGPTALSNYVINMEMYNNTIIAPNSVLCSQIANCFNCSASFNNFTCLWVMSFNNNTENVYVYNNTIDKYNINNWEGRCLYNVYAYNNSVNRVVYMNLVYGHNFCMNNVYIPTTETLDSYISVLIDYDELNYGDVYPNNYYDIVKQISINTNRIDYYIDFDSTGLSYGEYNISKENLYVSMSNSTQFSKIFSLPLRATYLKSAILETVNILHRIYIPNVPPGLYTGKIYITFGLGEVSNYNFGGEI